MIIQHTALRCYRYAMTYSGIHTGIIQRQCSQHDLGGILSINLWNKRLALKGYYGVMLSAQCMCFALGYYKIVSQTESNIFACLNKILQHVPLFPAKVLRRISIFKSINDLK